MRYEEGLKVLSEFHPQMAESVKALKDFSWKPVMRGSEIDLQRGMEFLHELQVEGSIRYWISQLNIKEVSGLVVYGLGLGHLWEDLKDWLHAKPYRHITFLEDDPEIVHHFLSLDRAIPLLKDVQVSLYPLKEGDEGFLWKVATKEIFLNVPLTALPSYKIRKEDRLKRLQFVYEFARYTFHIHHSEYFDVYRLFFQNFWGNLPLLAESYLGGSLRDRFKGIPAIICGAGPSLAKNIQMLPELKDNALILAGGTAVNILNSQGIDPHFTFGLDPFPSYLNRALNYTSFETPFFYKMRVKKEIFDVFRPPLVYLNMGPSYKVEEAFSLPHIDLSLGSNVVNASLSVAHFLGCSPLITVGVDLAYSGGESYAPGLTKHAVTEERLGSRNTWEEVVTRNDIHGKPIQTLWKWIHESIWYAEFQKFHPDAKIINSTEGGIGFPGIPNLPLATVKDLYMKESWDLSGRVHAVLEQSKMPPHVNKEALFKEIEEYLSSLVRILEKLETMKAPTRYGISEETKELDQEKGWTGLLKEFDAYYRDLVLSQELDLDKIHPILEHLHGHLDYLKGIVQWNISLIKKALSQQVDLPLEAPQDRAAREIVGESNFYDPDGDLLVSSAYKEGKREGPTKYWYAKGGLSADLYFSRGQYEGAQKTYYPHGGIKSIIPYSQGRLEGEVQLFWPNGAKRRVSHFKDHKRNGKDEIWDEKGTLLLSCEYVDNRPKGIARTWSHEGQLLHEIEYDEKGDPLSEHKGGDYFDFVSKTTHTLTDSLDGMASTLKELVKDETDLHALNEELAHLKSLGDELMNLSSIGRANETDMNPRIEKKVREEITEMSEKMKDVLQNMNFQIKDIRQKFKPDE